ncbi:hypothetical protein BMB171_C2724 [Bacillus thuringiensis BMB171]|nr:hypothetical protein BMB171_C2724 [Bacillus thuringiensis BMB171]
MLLLSSCFHFYWITIYFTVWAFRYRIFSIRRYSITRTLTSTRRLDFLNSILSILNRFIPNKSTMYKKTCPSSCCCYI